MRLLNLKLYAVDKKVIPELVSFFSDSLRKFPVFKTQKENNTVGFYPTYLTINQH
jgi:hypothetical protein